MIMHKTHIILILTIAARITQIELDTVAEAVYEKCGAQAATCQGDCAQLEFIL